MYIQQQLLIYCILLLMSIVLSAHQANGQVTDTSITGSRKQITSLKHEADSVIDISKKQIASLRKSVDTTFKKAKNQLKSAIQNADTLISQNKKQIKSLLKKTDSLPKQLATGTKKRALDFFRKQQQGLPDFKKSDSIVKAKLTASFINPFSFEKPLLSFNGGFLNYNGNYRS
jgi:predicted  nucleic acid-binding Zn-ribbon protein